MWYPSMSTGADRARKWKNKKYPYPYLIREAWTKYPTPMCDRDGMGEWGSPGWIWSASTAEQWQSKTKQHIHCNGKAGPARYDLCLHGWVRCKAGLPVDGSTAASVEPAVCLATKHCEVRVAAANTKTSASHHHRNSSGRNQGTAGRSCGSGGMDMGIVYLFAEQKPK